MTEQVINKPSASNRLPRISRRFVTLTVTFAVIHAVVFNISLGIAFTRSMERFDHLDLPETVLERICTMVTAVLMQPYGFLASATHLRAGSWDLALSLLNSLLWGATFALIFLLVRSRPKRPIKQE